LTGSYVRVAAGEAVSSGFGRPLGSGWAFGFSMNRSGGATWMPPNAVQAKPPFQVRPSSVYPAGMFGCIGISRAVRIG